MSADSTGAESAAASRRWYLEVSGRRAGPFAWTVLVELAQAGALGADDRVWRMGLAGWSRAADLGDLAPLIREPAPARTFTRAHARRLSPPIRWGIRLLAGICALLLLAVAVRPFLTGHVGNRISTEASRPSGGSPAAFARQASAFEGRYPFLTELRRVEPSRFERLDGAVRLGFRRGAPVAELNDYVAEAAGDMERGRLADVDDGSALRLLVALRGAARRFQSSAPSQCVAILRLRSGAAPIRSAAALTAISPALVGLLDAPAGPRGAPAHRDAPQPPVDTLGQPLPGAGPDAPNVNPKLDCDRLLLMYDTAVAASPDAGAAFVRAFQGGSGS
jgi:GYF domain 2